MWLIFIGLKHIQECECENLYRYNWLISSFVGIPNLSNHNLYHDASIAILRGIAAISTMVCDSSTPSSTEVCSQ